MRLVDVDDRRRLPAVRGFGRLAAVDAADGDGDGDSVDPQRTFDRIRLTGLLRKSPA